jgi:hypothetical protein
MFIPSKKAKFGIKIFCLVNPETKYLHNMEIYTGKQDQGGDKNLGGAVVWNLVSDFTDRGRMIVTDNFFTSPWLGQRLWDANTYLLGTIRKNREGTPKDFVEEKIQVLFVTSIQGYENLGRESPVCVPQRRSSRMP